MMALLVVKCFEDLLFSWLEKKSIKHLGKREAVARVMKELGLKGSGVLEGDGSAWDTTCLAKIREHVENPVLQKITKMLIEAVVVPPNWHTAQMEACERKEPSLFFSTSFETIRVKIDATRRNGHKGTSCLSCWVNCVLWACAVFAEPDKSLNVEARCGKDVVGQNRHWAGVFEGDDDSLGALRPPMRQGDDLSREFEATWKRCGFNMKIVYCTTRATFVGWNIAVDADGIGKCFAPELPRSFVNAGVSVSGGAKTAVKKGDVAALRKLAKASYVARAREFAGLLPSASRKFADYTRYLCPADVQDDEMSLRVTSGRGATSCKLLEETDGMNLSVDPEEEQECLRALGYPTSDAEMLTFTSKLWRMDEGELRDYERFRESLPALWR